MNTAFPKHLRDDDDILLSLDDDDDDDDDYDDDDDDYDDEEEEAWRTISCCNVDVSENVPGRFTGGAAKGPTSP